MFLIEAFACNSINWGSKKRFPHGMTTEHGMTTTQTTTFGIPFVRNSVQVANGITNRSHITLPSPNKGI